MIHRYKQNGYNIVLDIGSGSIHAVDDLVYDMLGMLDAGAPREKIAFALMKPYDEDGPFKTDIEEAFGEIDALIEAGKLFAPDNFEPLAGALKEKNTDIKALCLHISHACNLRCGYCFAGEGRYQGPSALMSLDVAKRAIDFLVEHSGTRRNLEVDFFGGEPLLNWDVVKQTVAYARSIEADTGKRFRFTLTTNGVLIDDDVIDFSNREMHNVVLSLDGRKAVHDHLRRTPDGGGSYDDIVPKFQRFVERRGRKNYYIRGTFTRHNTDFVDDILHMADLGFTELSMEPVVSAPDAPYALSEDDLPALGEQYERLAVEMRRRETGGNPFTFYHFMLDLKNGPCVYKRVSGCGSGTEYLAVTPSGDLYPCHQFVGEDDYLLGDIWKGVTNTEKRGEFAACNAYSRSECRDCWAKLYCAGGCAANAYHASGSVGGVYTLGCALFKKRVECAIMMQVDRAVNA